MFLNDLWYKEDLRFQAETQPDWCLGASRCGGNALSRDGLLRSTPGWWGQQYHGAFFDMSRTFAHLLLGKPCDSAECFARSQRLRNGMVSPDTGNTERDDLKGTRPKLGRWHPKSHYRIPCVLATAIIPSTATFSLSLNARGTCAKSVWSSLMRSICSDRCPFYEASVDDVSPVVFSYLSSLCLVSWCTYDTCDTI